MDGTASTSGSCGDGARATLTEGEKKEEGAENLSSSKEEEEVLQLLDNFCSIACLNTQYCSVGDPDPHVFGPSGSGSIAQRYGSGSFPFHIKVLSGLK